MQHRCFLSDEASRWHSPYPVPPHLPHTRPSCSSFLAPSAFYSAILEYCSCYTVAGSDRGQLLDIPRERGGLGASTLSLGSCGTEGLQSRDRCQRKTGERDPLFSDYSTTRNRCSAIWILTSSFVPRVERRFRGAFAMWVTFPGTEIQIEGERFSFQTIGNKIQVRGRGVR